MCLCFKNYVAYQIVIASNRSFYLSLSNAPIARSINKHNFKCFLFVVSGILKSNQNLGEILNYFVTTLS
jgi:hypothetical protein